MDAEETDTAVFETDIFDENGDILLENKKADQKLTDKTRDVDIRIDNCKSPKILTNAAKSRITSRHANPLFLLLRIVFETFLMKRLVFLLFLTQYVSGYQQKFAIEPQDQSAVVGSRVTLPCRVVHKAGQLQWTKDDFGLGTHRHLTGYERYKMIGSDEEGDYSLDIRDVTIDDDALYQCQVSTGPKGEAAIRSKSARLTVLVPPEPPKILKGPVLEAVEDSEVTLECVSVGGKPAAEITWVDNDGGVLSQGVTYTIEQMADGRRFIARSTLRIHPRRHHHDQTYTCQAQNTADRAYRAATVKLKIQYAPKVKVVIKSRSTNGRIHEGDALVVGCQATANPSNLTYRWFINNEQVPTAKNIELIISNVSRRHNEATVKCEVQNQVGKSADSKTLEVSYGPAFRTRPQNVQGDIGSSATLTCLVDGHPQPKVYWMRYEQDRIIKVAKSSNLTLTISKQTAGQYWCRASVDGYQDIEAPAMVYVKGPPKIMSNQTQYGVEGGSVHIECVSFSVPKPDLVIWSFGGYELSSFHNQEYVFLEESLPDGLTKSTLIIRESQLKHFGSYNCTVSNAYGTDSVEINVVPDKSIPLIVIVCTGSLITIVILIIMLAVMLCHRRAGKDLNKPDITEVGKTCDPYKDSDRNSTISDLKLELRQVEGSCDMDNSNNGSETDLRSTLQLTTNLGLPLAGPVPLPNAAYDNELMDQYQRYSDDFNQPLHNIHFKTHDQTNGYVPYVDYSRDYAPPQTNDSMTGSLSRSTDASTYQSHCGSLNRQGSCGRLGGMIGPDLIPMGNPGVLITGGVDVRYAATYGNPYLRGSSGPMSYIPPSNPAKNAPPPYYTLRNTNHHPPSTSVTSPSSSSSSRPFTSPPTSSPTSNHSAQPQVPKPLVQATGGLYILPPSSQGSMHSSQISTKGTGTHV
ncbi:irregular chiasm C-roughest protein [Bicyclus anynana]|uniref:Irregular chiasm C-roughest protein n=1 Tax=Bicyclus anynana TaxID=110368 RepID=A0ABM3LUH6_BICAN|nr:irregular chiasm C-roughest protein [Bicyclus anynana]XP_052742689.1 irregular chiasm C-roughest protein [Bicyclus anynana]